MLTFTLHPPPLPDDGWVAMPAEPRPAFGPSGPLGEHVRFVFPPPLDGVAVLAAYGLPRVPHGPLS